MSKFILHVNDEALEVSEADILGLDNLELGESIFHIINGNQGYDVQIRQNGYPQKNLDVVINGNSYTVRIEDPYDQLVKQMGLLSNASQKINDVKAPMPGLILDIKVEPGQEIQKDDQLLILSAMKMENIILAAGDGTVKSVNVKVGDAVDKGQVIIEME